MRSVVEVPAQRGSLDVGDEAVENAFPFGGAAQGHRHPYDVLPLVLVRIVQQQREITLLDDGLGAQIVLEGAVDEVDAARDRLPQQTGALQQMS